MSLTTNHATSSKLRAMLMRQKKTTKTLVKPEEKLEKERHWTFFEESLTLYQRQYVAINVPISGIRHWRWSGMGRRQDIGVHCGVINSEETTWNEVWSWGGIEEAQTAVHFTFEEPGMNGPIADVWCKISLLFFGDFQARSATDAELVKKAQTEGIRWGGEMQKLPGQIVEEALIMAKMLNLNEISALQLLLKGEWPLIANSLKSYYISSLLVLQNWQAKNNCVSTLDWLEAWLPFSFTMTVGRHWFNRCALLFKEGKG